MPPCHAAVSGESALLPKLGTAQEAPLRLVQPAKVA